MQQINIQYLLKSPATIKILKQMGLGSGRRSGADEYPPVFWQIQRMTTITSIGNIPDVMGANLLQP